MLIGNFVRTTFKKFQSLTPDPDTIYFLYDSGAIYLGSVCVGNTLRGKSGIVISDSEPNDPDHPVWLDPDGEVGPLDLDITGASVGQVPAVKSVDESGVPTEWEAVEFPSSSLVVNLTMGDGGTITADKTFAEIKAASDDGKAVNAKFDDLIVPLCSLINSDAIFSMTNATSDNVATASLFCTSDNVWSMSQDGFDAYSLGLTGATVGQTAKIKAVDENGVPTEWEAADAASGEVKLIASCTLEETASAIEFTGLNTKNKSISIRIKNTGSSCGNGWQIWVNGVRQDGSVGSTGSTSTYYADNRIWLFPDGSTLRGISQCANGGTNHYNWTNFQGTITSIKLTSTYHSDTSKYYDIGTNVEVYEGILPNIK